MKTTVEISDLLLQEAQEVAAREHTTLRALIESGIREVLDRRKRSTRLRLRDASVKGKGLRPEFRDANWAQIREESYKRNPG